MDRRPSAADLRPVTRRYVDSMGWRSVNFHTHISLVHRYVYVEVPKAGCGTMKATLGALEGARMNPTHAQRFQDKPHNGVKSGAHVRPYQLPVDLLEEVLSSPTYHRFTVVRDPASRVLSAYLEKMHQGLQQSEGILDALERTIGQRPTAPDVSLTTFLQVIADQPSREQDPHWRRQVDHIGLGIVPYDAVIHLEDLDASWATVAHLTRTPDLTETFYCRNSTGASAKVAEYFDDTTWALVRQIYARDYAELGY